MATEPVIRFNSDELAEVLKLGAILEELVICLGKISNIMGHLASNENSNEVYMGKALSHTVIYYQTLQKHLNSMANFYSVALQQAFASYAEIHNADNAGAGG